MAEITEESVLGALESTFGDAPKAAPAPRPAPAPEPENEDVSLLDAADLNEGEPEPAEIGEDGEPVPAIAEPEFEIEVNGQKEVIKGKQRVTELLQKGLSYGRASEEVARARDQLMAQAQIQQNQVAFQQAAFGDIAALQQIDAQLEQFNKLDWASAIDTDFVGVMKLQEQRAALREAKNVKMGELNQKQQAFMQYQTQATQQLLSAEENALFAKLPSWRNSETAAGEKLAIAKGLSAQYGFHASELSQIMDHRMIIVARDAMKWQELQRNKSGRTKQLREAPPVSKPGAAAAQQGTNDKTAFGKFVQDFRKQGRSGNHRAQETSLEKMLSRTFK